MARRAAVGLVVIVFAVACRRAGPDENYAKASEIYQRLYVKYLDDAYGDPRMQDVVALLRQVNPRSVDAEAARRLIGTIERGQAEYERQRGEREKHAREIEESLARRPTYEPTLSTPAQPPPPPPDAGPVDPYGEGASIADINTATGGCLVGNEPFRENGTGRTGTIYRLASEACASKLPGFVGQAVLSVDGRIYRRMSESDIPKPGRDAGPAPDPHSRAGSHDAGTLSLYPGQPLPPGYVYADGGR